MVRVPGGLRDGLRALLGEARIGLFKGRGVGSFGFDLVGGDAAHFGAGSNVVLCGGETGFGAMHLAHIFLDFDAGSVFGVTEIFFGLGDLGLALVDLAATLTKFSDGPIHFEPDRAAVFA